MKFRILMVVLIIGIFSWSLPVNADDGETVEITVAKQDTLINICKKLLEDPRQWRTIAKINKLQNPDLILPGQRLIVPAAMLRGMPVVGTVTFISGEVKSQARPGEEWRPLGLNDKVKPGSSIRTEDESAVEITFEDGVSLFMKGNTSLTLKRVEKRGLMHFLESIYLHMGRAVTRIKEATGGKSRFEIHTPSAAAVARGTEFRVSVDANESTRSEVLKGVVGVEAMAREVEVREGEGTIVKKNEPPQRPRKLLAPPLPVHIESSYISLPLTLRFSAIEGASFYRVMLTRDSAGKDVIIEKIVRPEDAWEIMTINDGQYFLTSLGIDADGLEGLPSPPEMIRVRTNPLPPFILSPADAAACSDQKIRFIWAKVKDAARYHLQIAEDKEFARVVLDKGDVTGTEFVASSLDFRPYYFRVSSIAEDGFEGGASDIQSCTVMASSQLPAGERSGIEKKEVLLKWHSLGEGITYRFQLADDTAFKNILVDAVVKEPEIAIEKPEKGGIYYARIKSIDQEGHEGDFSVPQTLESRKRLQPPMILSPSERAEFRGPSKIAITWSEVPDAAGYHFILAKDRTFMRIVSEEKRFAGLSSTTEALGYGTYFFKICSVTSDGIEGPFSDALSFVVAPAVPSDLPQK